MDIRAAACILMTVASVGAASAHHGWGSYDATKVFTISAPVETLAWADPHTHITVKYQGNTWEATLARLHAEQGRQRRLPGVALVFDRDVGVRVRPGQRLDWCADGENLGGVVAAPAVMRRGRADRGDGHEDTSGSANVHDEILRDSPGPAFCRRR